MFMTSPPAVALGQEENKTVSQQSKPFRLKNTNCWNFPRKRLLSFTHSQASVWWLLDSGNTVKQSYFKCAVKNIVPFSLHLNCEEIQNNAFNRAVKKLQVPNMEKVDVIIIRQPHGKRFYLVVSIKTHTHARTHEPLETITMSAFNPRLQRKIPGNLRH